MSRNWKTAPRPLYSLDHSKSNFPLESWLENYQARRFNVVHPLALWKRYSRLVLVVRASLVWCYRVSFWLNKAVFFPGTLFLAGVCTCIREHTDELSSSLLQGSVFPLLATPVGLRVLMFLTQCHQERYRASVARHTFSKQIL